MIEPIFPAKLVPGDTIEIIAPSQSLATIGKEEQEIANHWYETMGLRVTFAKHVLERDIFDSSSIESRVEDLMGAFLNPNAKAIICATGGFNSNQLLRYLDWRIIQQHPKIFIGFSDISALNNAIYAKTGLVTYSGPTYSTFTQKLFVEYTLEYFKRCVCANEPFDIVPSDTWSDDDEVAADQEDRHQSKNDGWQIFHEGVVEGRIIGANQCTFNLLQGTEYMPDFKNSILFLEDDHEILPHHFDRDLQSLIHQPGFEQVQAMVIGRFQNASKMTSEKLMQILQTKKELQHMPIITNVDFGHTNPKVTFPIGGVCKIVATKGASSIRIVTH